MNSSLVLLLSFELLSYASNLWFFSFFFAFRYHSFYYCFLYVSVFGTSITDSHKHLTLKQKIKENILSFLGLSSLPLGSSSTLFWFDHHIKELKDVALVFGWNFKGILCIYIYMYVCMYVYMYVYSIRWAEHAQPPLFSPLHHEILFSNSLIWLLFILINIIMINVSNFSL